jgi:hypothetical protein
MEKEMVMGRNLVITTNLNNFQGVPDVGGFNGYTLKFYNPKIPKNIVLGKTYYTIEDGNLIAFRIKAYSFTQNVCETRTWCFVETPNDSYWSLTILDKHIFENVEDYYTYLASGKGNLKICYDYFTNDDKEKKGFALLKTYYWNKREERPKATNTRMHYVLVDEENVYVGIDYHHSQYNTTELGYSSGEECIKANIDGMKIIEFAEPKVSFSFHIEEPTEPKIRVLKFID